MQKINPFLWFEKEAGQAAKFYTSIFENSRIKNTTRLENTPSGTVEVVDLELLGQEFTLMAAGPLFKFTPAVSFLVLYSEKEKVDALWQKLSQGGTELMP